MIKEGKKPATAAVTTVTVGLASCGIAAAAQKVYDAFRQALEGLPAALNFSGCMGMCFNEPLVEVRSPNDGRRYIYGKVQPEWVERIVGDHIKNGLPIEEWLVYADGTKTPLAVDGYKAIKKALKSMAPEKVIAEIDRSGLRGRGGGGVSTATKWSFARKSPGREKYVICNADEGDPGAFMDRSVLESNPHSVLEGMLIAGYARQMLKILNRITDGEGKDGDIEMLEDLGKKISAGSPCGLGQSAPNPVLTTIKYFRSEYEAHIYDKKCPAKKCKALIRYEVAEEKCKGCGRCNKQCPTGAIAGEKKQPFAA